MLYRVVLLLAFSVFSSSSFAADFKNPQRVNILNLPKGTGGTAISTEEPFISRDGRFLMFNTASHENHRDLHYAKKINAQWVYQGEIGESVNTKDDVQGNPTMDSQNNIYYVDTTAHPMIRAATFSPATGLLKNIRDFEGVPTRKVQLFKQKFTGNMGVEISKDGRFAFFSRATWNMIGLKPGLIIASNLLLSKREGREFVYNETYAKHILQNINTDDLEYAASISENGKELFFTRWKTQDLRKGLLRSVIMRASRDSWFDPFSKPEVIRSIGSRHFVEGPAISPDGKQLYYHKKEGNKFRIYKVTR